MGDTPNLNAMAKELLDLLAPQRCSGCDLVLERPAQDPAAQDPAAQNPQIPRGWCRVCADLMEPTPPERQPPRKQAATYLYAGPLADAIQRWKYNARLDHTRALCELLDPHIPRYGGRIDAVAPIPLHRSRLWKRGFNPAHLLARHVSRQLRIPLLTALTRTRPTPPQARLDRAHRASNVRGAFCACTKPTPARVLIVDDVHTTGATLREARRTLLEAGTPTVHTLTLAWSPPQT